MTMRAFGAAAAALVLVALADASGGNASGAAGDRPATGDAAGLPAIAPDGGDVIVPDGGNGSEANLTRVDGAGRPRGAFGPPGLGRRVVTPLEYYGFVALMGIAGCLGCMLLSRLTGSGGFCLPIGPCLLCGWSPHPAAFQPMFDFEGQGAPAPWARQGPPSMMGTGQIAPYQTNGGSFGHAARGPSGCYLSVQPFQGPAHRLATPQGSQQLALPIVASAPPPYY